MLLGTTWSRCNSPWCSTQHCKTRPAAWGQWKGEPREYSPALGARNGDLPLPITACNISCTVLRHQPVLPPLSCLHLKKRQKLFTISPSSSFLPHKEELARSASFFQNCFLFLMLKASARQLGSMLRCQLFSSSGVPVAAPRGGNSSQGTKGRCVWKLCCEEQDSSAFTRWNLWMGCLAHLQGTAQHGLSHRKGKFSSGCCVSVAGFIGLWAGALHLAELLAWLPDGTWV